jgi:UDP-glucuronate 4-epimerase
MSPSERRVLVTGVAGFIGFHVAARLLTEGASVLGIDNLNSYYDPALKQARLDQLGDQPRLQIEIADLTDHERVVALIHDFRPSHVVHLAAQAGVRYSLDNPRAYLASNVDGFLTILEACRRGGVGHLLYASSSSVYGGNRKVPFSETDPTEQPLSLYAATKRANELMAYTYAHLYGVCATGLRFFTVYGPWGRPDMAYYSFTRAIFEGRPIEVFSEGQMSRDFTYIDDVVEAVLRLLDHRPGRPDAAGPPHAVLNIGNNRPVPLERFIEIIGAAAGREVRKTYRPDQPGDVRDTYADTTRLQEAIGFAPRTGLEDGLGRFVAWYRDYHGVR